MEPQRIIGGFMKVYAQNKADELGVTLEEYASIPLLSSPLMGVKYCKCTEDMPHDVKDLRHKAYSSSISQLCDCTKDMPPVIKFMSDKAYIYGCELDKPSIDYYEGNQYYNYNDYGTTFIMDGDDIVGDR